MGASASGNSYLDVFKRCPRKFYYAHVLKLKPKGRALPLDTGTLVHEGLAVLGHHGIDAAEAQIKKVWKEEMEDYWAANEYGDQTTALDVALLLVQGYAVEHATSPFIPLVDEFEFAFTLPSGATYTGKLDRLVKGPEGRVYVMEHKTTALNPTQYFKSFFLNPQITGYYIGATEATPDSLPISGVIVDVLLKPRKKKAGGFSPLTENNFAQELFTRTPMQIEEFITNTDQVFQEIERCGTTKSNFYRCENECYSFFKACPYLDLCMYGDDEHLMETSFDHPTEEEK